jgi:hypothetical protein
MKKFQEKIEIKLWGDETPPLDIKVLRRENK